MRAEALAESGIVVFDGGDAGTIISADGENADPTRDFRCWELVINGSVTDGKTPVAEENSGISCSLRLAAVDPRKVLDKSVLAVGAGENWFLLTVIDRLGYVNDFIV